MLVQPTYKMVWSKHDELRDKALTIAYQQLPNILINQRGEGILKSQISLRGLDYKTFERLAMNERNKSTKKESTDTLKELQKYAQKESERLFKNRKKSNFDEKDLASGSKDLLEKSDAELFPDEIEEYTEKEKRPKVIADNKPKKK
ncbi:hypothetical protein [Microbulbifer sp.]|uniref:hypothetical protein n=1 Tax=Microbulbifer sp. TaxID=1908541 RepID=UPI003F2FF522